ncbi:MAG: hypothetical protein JWO37_471 [Acidimicrobiales bacterium]|jgi:hypothetical protein|nr:hypothetical protein [Acidimicrobiales bacterium]
MTARDERGMGGVEVLPFGILIFVVGTLLVAFAWGVVDAKVAVSTAAREAARSYVESPVHAAGDTAVAERDGDDAARRAVADQGRISADPPLAVSFAIDAASGEAGFARCNVVTVTASYRVPVFNLPWARRAPLFFRTTARHREVIDPLRSGVASDPRGHGASCNVA